MDNKPILRHIQAHPGPQQAGEEHDRYEKFQAERQLTQAISGSNEPLASATTVFPFTLFPDRITVDREKFTVSHRVFFGVAEVISIRVGDILNVTADVGPFFGSLRISTRFFTPNEPYKVNYLWRSDALRFKRIIQGYIIAIKKKIDSSALSTPELAKLLDELGQAEPGEEM